MRSQLNYVSVFGYPAVVSVFLFTTAVPQALYARWEGTQDNKSIADLGDMNDEELFQEAFDVCVGQALLQGPRPTPEEETNSIASGASDYLTTIGDILAARHDGIVPEWMLTLRSAHTGRECQRAFDAFLEAKEPAKPQAKLKSGATAKRTAAPTSRHPPTDLPPWFAPH
jgi:hypothetical protein